MPGMCGAVSVLWCLTDRPANLLALPRCPSRAANTEPHCNTRAMHTMMGRRHVSDVTATRNQIWHVPVTYAMTSQHLLLFAKYALKIVYCNCQNLLNVFCY